MSPCPVVIVVDLPCLLIVARDGVFCRSGAPIDAIVRAVERWARWQAPPGDPVPDTGENFARTMTVCG